MPRGKTVQSQAQAIARGLTPAQLRELAALLANEAEKPRLDRRAYSRLERRLRTLYAAVESAEEEFAAVLTEAGKTNDEINADLDRMKRAGKPEKRTRRPRAASNS